MICKEIDLFIVGNPMWVARLSNGETVYQDDYRPDYEESSAWIRLSQYISINKLKIVNLGLRFKTNQFWMEPDKPGYFFSKVAGATWGDDNTFHYYKIGYIDGNMVKTWQYTLPELTLFHMNEKSIEECMPGTLIING